MFRIIKKILKALYRISPFLKVRILLLRLAGYKIGHGVYIPADLVISDLSCRRGNLEIGDRVSCGPGVILITDSSPNNSKLIKKYPLASGKIVIEDDAWIGAGVIVLQNVTIGKCSVVAAGAVVTESVPEYFMVGGIPSKVIKKIIDVEL